MQESKLKSSQKKQVNLIRKFFNEFSSDSLYRNSIYLMLGTAIMAALGFIFWAIVSRMYTAEQVGLATTVISVMGLITSFSLLGLNTGLIRFLPSSDRKNDKINTCFSLAAVVTIIISTIFLLGLQGFSPKLIFIKKNVIYSFVFIIFMVFSTLSSLIESVFISYRSSGYILLKNSIFSIFKLIFPAALVFLGAYGIFGSWMLSLIISFIVTFYIMIYKFSYVPKMVFYDSIILKIGRYSFGNYIAGFIGGASVLLLPLMITNLHYPEMTAYYYMAMTIASVLYIIPTATSNAVFAEGSNNQAILKKAVKKAAKIISALMLPAIVIILIAGKIVLSFFGEKYAANGYPLLIILSIAGIFISINSVYGTILRVRNKIKTMIIMSTFNAITTLGLSYLFIMQQTFHLNYIGYAYLAGQVVNTILYVFIVKR
jgi:O-antigen/teichoic acid export membrane protein